MQRKILILIPLLFAIFFFGARSMYAEETPGFGFSKNTVTLSKEYPASGESVEIRAGIFNDEKQTIKGILSFYDGTLLLGARDFTIDPGTKVETAVDWKATPGDHKISAHMSEIKTISSRGEVAAYSVEQTDTDTVAFFVPQTVKSMNSLLAEGDAAVSDTKTNVVNALAKSETSLAGKASSFIGGIENFRTEQAEKFGQKEIDVQTLINERNKLDDAINKEQAQVDPDTFKEKTYVDPDKGQPFKRPLALVKLYYYKTVYFIFDHPIVFYLVLLFIIFMILRFFYRLIF